MVPKEVILVVKLIIGFMILLKISGQKDRPLNWALRMLNFYRMAMQRSCSQFTKRPAVRKLTGINFSKGYSHDWNSIIISHGNFKVHLYLLLIPRLPSYAAKFIEMCLMVTADHGPAVSGAHNTIVCARAGKDLISSLTSGLLTIVSTHYNAPYFK